MIKIPLIFLAIKEDFLKKSFNIEQIEPWMNTKQNTPPVYKYK